MIQRYDVKTRSAIPQILAVEEPNVEPIGVQDYLNYASLHYKDIKNIFTTKLITARELVEDYTGRALVTRKAEQIVDYDPKNNPTGIPLYMTSAVGEIDLRLPPVRKILQVTVYDPFRQPTLVDPSVYLPLFITDPSTKVIVQLGHVWPGILSDVQSIRMQCISGYATYISSVDTTADTITAPGHPYAEGDTVRITMAYGDDGAAPVVPGGLTARTNYYALNVSGDTFQLAASVGGEAINITSSGQGKLFAGEIPSRLLEAIMITASANLMRDEFNETDKERVALPKAAKDMVRRFKRNYVLIP